jgi:hypothetical protein
MIRNKIPGLSSWTLDELAGFLQGSSGYLD